jgi:hypothetical protein
VVEEASEVTTQTPNAPEPRCNNAKTLREHGIQSLFHFTDASNLESIRQHGLLTWKKLEEMKISAKVNSSELSHKLDSSKGLADFVRLSFCKKHPMMYIALKEKRISVPVVLEIKLEVVSRPGVLFCGVNAAAKAAKASESPRVIRFDVVRAYSQHDVDQSLRPFFQGEVLVPDWIPPHLIKIPKVDIFTNSLELSGRLLNSGLAQSASKGEREGLVKASEPKPRVSPIEVIGARNGKSSHETFAASRILGKPRTLPWASNLLTEFQRERKERLFALVPPHVPVGTQFRYDLDENFREKNKKRQKNAALPEKPCGSLVGECQMPLSRSKSKSCQDCSELHLKINCALHMKQCNAPAWTVCDKKDGCLRFLCWKHREPCYCETKTLGAVEP